MHEAGAGGGIFINEAERDEAARPEQPGARPEGGWRAAEDKVGALAAGLGFAGGEALMGDEQVVQPAGTGEAGLQRRVQ